MATLGSPVPDPFRVDTLWCLRHSLDAYSRPRGSGLATQVAAGRHLRVLEDGGPRLRIRLLEDGYPCWLEPGDLIFFGTPRRCTHVGLHLGGGRYLHSSGRDHGRNGIGIDDLNPRNSDPVANHYRAELRGAGRVMHSHDGSPLPP